MKSIHLHKLALSWTTLRRVLIPISMGLILLMQTGCSVIRGTNVELRNAVDTFDRSIDALARQSADWQVVLQDLEETIMDDAQSTLRVEVMNLMESGVLSAGGEFRCDAEFLRIRTEQELRRIRNELAEAINDTGINPPIPLLPNIPVEPYICNATPGSVDFSLDANRRGRLDVYGFNLLSIPITADVVSVTARRNVTGALGIISDMHMVLDLTDSGAAIDENSRRVVFSWNGVSQSVIPVISPESAATCSTRIEMVTGDPHTFIPPRTGEGNARFNNNDGPCVEFWLSLNLDPEGTRLTANYEMVAYECDDSWSSEYDHTRAEGTGELVLYRVTSPDRIIGFNLDRTIDPNPYSYRDSDESDDIYTLGGALNPVEKLRFVGNADGGDDAGTDTLVEIFFRELEIQVESCVE